MIRFILVFGGVAVVLLVWSLFDVYFAPAGLIRRYTRGIWFALVVVPILGPIAWIRYGRPQRQRPMRTNRRGPAAPDDDPDFLSKL